jgi:hypothetical protein
MGFGVKRMLLTGLLSGLITLTGLAGEVLNHHADPIPLHRQPIDQTIVTVSEFNAMGEFESLTIPLKRAGKLILVEAVIDSVPGNLIFDTGAMGLVLNSIYFRRSQRSGGQGSGGITGKMEPVSKTKIKNLQISDLYYENLITDITDLGHIENARQVKVLGFFGLSLLTDFEVVIDLNNNVLELHRTDWSGKRTYQPELTPVYDLTLPVTSVSEVLFIEARIGTKKLTFCLDTGAESNVLSSDLPGKILNTVTVLRRSKLRGAGTESAEAIYGIMNDFSIDEYKIPGMQTIVTNLTAMKTAYNTYLDGMLGCDFFEQGVIYINLKRNKIGICLNKNQKK